MFERSMVTLGLRCTVTLETFTLVTIVTSDFTLVSMTTVMLTHSCTLLYCCIFVSYLKMYSWTNSTNFEYLHPVVECMIDGIA